MNARWIGLPVLAAVACLCLQQPAGAQKLSNRTITFVVPTTAGTSMDFLARIVADEIKHRWDQVAVVENKAGASPPLRSSTSLARNPTGTQFCPPPIR